MRREHTSLSAAVAPWIMASDEEHIFCLLGIVTARSLRLTAAPALRTARQILAGSWARYEAGSIMPSPRTAPRTKNAGSVPKGQALLERLELGAEPSRR